MRMYESVLAALLHVALASSDLSPRYHAFPSSQSSQDISGPIGIRAADGRVTWHVFVDCVPEGSPSLSHSRLGPNLSWCHMSSTDLVHWYQHPVAIEPDRDFDSAVIDTGSVFQHPNGTVFALYATSNATSNLESGDYDGNICLARAKDASLLYWEKLCDRPGGSIVNPACHWCRETCPADCKGGEGSKLPSPFPGILGFESHRDPTQPWLDACAPGESGAAAAPSDSRRVEQCWYVLVGSGGRVPQADNAQASVATL